MRNGKLIINKLIKNKFFFIKLYLLFLLFLKVVNECNRDTPIKLSSNGQCYSKYCTKEEFNSSYCSINNSIIKTQWLNNIILLKDYKLKYFNFIISESGNLFFETYPYPSNDIRIFYGLRQNGRYYFNEENNSNETPFLKLTNQINGKSKTESMNSYYISSNGKEFILSIGNMNSYTEIYDFENKKIYSRLSSELFDNIYNIRANLIKLNDIDNNGNNNIYLFEYLSRDNEIQTAVIIKFTLSVIDNLNSISISQIEKNVRYGILGEMISCFETENKIIICFYINNNPSEHYDIVAYYQNLTLIDQKNLMYDDININYYFSCIHYEGEIGAFIYYRYSNNNSSKIMFPYIFFKIFTNEIEDYFSEVILDEYPFLGTTKYNDFKKISDKKIAYFSISEDKKIIYIVLLRITTTGKIIKYYSINAYDLYNFKIYTEIKTIIYNKFIVYGSDLCPDENCNYENGKGNYYTSFIIFSYPNGVDNNIDVIEYLKKNRHILINNLIFNLTENLIIDNNIFGYVYNATKIQNIIYKTQNINLISSKSKELIYSNYNMSKTENLKVEFINNIYSKFEFKLEYAFIVTEPDNEDNKKYPIKILTDFDDSNELFFQKDAFIGKTLYFNVSLNEDLSTNCKDKECPQCLAKDLNQCIYNYIGCSNEKILNNDCLDQKIEKNKIEEIGNILQNQVTNSSFNNVIIKTKNAIFQMTSIEEQKNDDNNEISSIDFGECENILKKWTNNPLKLLKIDVKSEDLLSTYTKYDIYDSVSGIKFDLSICSDIPIVINSPKILDYNTLTMHNSLSKYGYDLFNSSDPFYNDICTVYTSIYGKDVLLIDRWNDIYVPNNDKYFCQEGCKFVSYNIRTQKAKCNCYIQAKQEINFNVRKMIESFSIALKNSNFLILKCLRLLFSNKSFKNNYGSFIMIVIMVFFSSMMIFYFIIGKKKIQEIIKSIIYIKKEELNNKKKVSKNKKLKGKNLRKNLKTPSKIIKNDKNVPPKKRKNQKAKSIINIGKLYCINASDSNNINNSSIKNNISSLKLKKSKSIITIDKKLDDKLLKDIEINKNDNNLINKDYFKMNDTELNCLDYLKAIKLDKRTYFNYYISLLKTRHVIIFTFFLKNDYNLLCIKISLLLISFSLYFTMNGFFFSDSTMHKIYQDIAHAYNFIYQISIIIYSTLISAVLNSVLRNLSLSEKDILSIKKEKNFKKAMEKSIEVQKCIKIKFIIFYIISHFVLLFCWYFISCFCAVYVNTAIILIKDTFISFGLSMIYPFGIYLLPGIFRIPALNAKNKDKEIMYKFSQFISLI